MTSELCNTILHLSWLNALIIKDSRTATAILVFFITKERWAGIVCLVTIIGTDK